MAKYLYDKGYVRSENISVETAGGIHRIKVYLRDGKVSSASVDMGKPSLLAKDIPALTDSEKMINYPISVSGAESELHAYRRKSALCCIFKSIDGLDLKTSGLSLNIRLYFLSG